MPSLHSHATELQQIWKGQILWDCPLARFSTLKVGGPAEAVLIAQEQEGLSRLIRWLNGQGIGWQVIGRGSNILVPDEGLTGAVIILDGELAAIEEIAATDSGRLLRAGAGASLARLAAYCTDQGLTGLEFTVGIPGSFGGAIVMNAGAWGREIGALIESVTLLDRQGDLHVIERPALKFSYRRWENFAQGIVLSAILTVANGDRQMIASTCREYAESRRRKQPQGVASAGSFFKNPAGQAAGRLIDEAGLKGTKFGGAMVSMQHANFIVNTGTASARDIFALMREIQTKVFDKFGIRLEPEVHILGQNGN
ncbi:MAG: UDP-N-acetylenolpyruvoylglucosamine reductase [Deltaproteobacteria bacterium RIFOXYD12_FULL_57_12]|nr:MAG: UDP-N-acetylenolpyruvoylglucosamine reductase [Deltaproteobacteria bacterium RIFOXYD12_FULL_57_12]